MKNSLKTKYARKKTAEQRFHEKVKRQHNGCWEWQGGTKRGYGRFWLHGEDQLAHRAALMLEGVDIPSGMCVCHTCDNPMCVNTAHLFVGTNQDNMDDRKRKGRNSLMQGENSPRSKLREDDVRNIREMNRRGLPQSEIAYLFSLSRSQVNNIVHRRQWSHVN